MTCPDQRNIGYNDDVMTMEGRRQRFLHRFENRLGALPPDHAGEAGKPDALSDRSAASAMPAAAARAAVTGEAHHITLANRALRRGGPGPWRIRQQAADLVSRPLRWLFIVPELS